MALRPLGGVDSVPGHRLFDPPGAAPGSAPALIESPSLAAPVAVEPVVEEVPAEPVVEEVPAEPVVEEVPAEPVVEESTTTTTKKR